MSVVQGDYYPASVHRHRNGGVFDDPFFRQVASTFAHPDFWTRLGSVPAAASAAAATTIPRADVKETKGGYVIEADVPGYKKEDISIEFTDSRTLQISGRTASISTSTSSKPAQVEELKESASSSGDSQAVHASRPKSPTVEDVPDESEVDGGKADKGQTGDSIPIGKGAEKQQQQEQSKPAAHQTQVTRTSSAQGQQLSDDVKYYTSERFVGSFSRQFVLPANIDHNGVQAKLEHGVLTVQIPKVNRGETRKIVVH